MTAVAPAPSALTVKAPEGARFDFEEVKTAGGTKSLGDKPMLVWFDIDKARAYYGDEGLCRILDGTSLRVSFQNIARRYTIAAKSDDDIAKAQIEFRPGKRVIGESTPKSRVQRLVGQAVEKGADPDAIEKLLAKVLSGQLSNDDIAAMAS